MEKMTHTTAYILNVKKGIAVGELITDEQEKLLQELEIVIPEVDGELKVKYVHRKLDMAVKRMTPKSKKKK